MSFLDRILGRKKKLEAAQLKDEFEAQEQKRKDLTAHVDGLLTATLERIQAERK